MSGQTVIGKVHIYSVLPVHAATANMTFDFELEQVCMESRNTLSQKLDSTVTKGAVACHQTCGRQPQGVISIVGTATSSFRYVRNNHAV